MDFTDVSYAIAERNTLNTLDREAGRGSRVSFSQFQPRARRERGAWACDRFRYRQVDSLHVHACFIHREVALIRYNIYIPLAAHLVSTEPCWPHPCSEAGAKRISPRP